MTGRRVLVLDGHTTQALACVRSLGRAGRTVFVASTHARPLAAWSRYCRGHFRIAGDTIAGFAALRAWARDREVQVVLPQGERSCALCNAEREQWEALGIVVGCGPDDMLLRAFDKARTLEYAAASGVRFPPTRVPASLEECRAAGAEIGYPCIVKPRFSEFWDDGTFLPDHGTRYARNAAELEAAALECRQGPNWPLIQGLVPGQGKGVFVLCDQGKPVVWFAHERLRDVRPSGSGSSVRRSVPLDPRTLEPAARLLASMGWHGPAMIEFRDDGVAEPWLIEVNGRFWSSLALSVASGVDFPNLWTSVLCGEEVLAPTGYRTGVTLRWLWGDVKRLLHIAAGPPAGFTGPYPSVFAGLREILGSQAPGTRSETWDANDHWPALGEWIQGVRELAAAAWHALAVRFAPRPAAPARRASPPPPAAHPLQKGAPS